MFRSAALFVAAAALAFATTAAAQPATPEGNPPIAASPPAPPPATAAAAYSDQQMKAFARATLDLQGVRPTDTEGMTRTIEAAGMSVEQYNAMGDAMRADPAAAGRLDPYLQWARLEHTPAYNPHPYAPSRRHAASHAARGRHHAGARHRGKATSSHHHRAAHASAHKSAGHHPRHRR